jgi:hypothetical protein
MRMLKILKLALNASNKKGLTNSKLGIEYPGNVLPQRKSSQKVMMATNIKKGVIYLGLSSSLATILSVKGGMADAFET